MQNDETLIEDDQARSGYGATKGEMVTKWDGSGPVTGGVFFVLGLNGNS